MGNLGKLEHPEERATKAIQAVTELTGRQEIQDSKLLIPLLTFS
jgi:hypothetical protein